MLHIPIWNGYISCVVDIVSECQNELWDFKIMYFIFLRLRMEGRPPNTEGSYEYIE